MTVAFYENSIPLVVFRKIIFKIDRDLVVPVPSHEVVDIFLHRDGHERVFNGGHFSPFAI